MSNPAVADMFFRFKCTFICIAWWCFDMLMIRTFQVTCFFSDILIDYSSPSGTVFFVEDKMNNPHILKAKCCQFWWHYWEVISMSVESVNNNLSMILSFYFTSMYWKPIEVGPFEAMLKAQRFWKVKHFLAHLEFISYTTCCILYRQWQN